MLSNQKSDILPRIFPFLKWWPQVNRDTLRADIIAGLTGAIIVLPQGVAFAMIAGLPPIYGLYTAMVTPVIAALFGSSKHLVSGPTTAISLVIFATVGKFAEPFSADFIQMALTITLLAGIFQLVLGLARMGTLINFVSHVVVVGFTAGAALLIMFSQLKHILGLKVKSGGSLISSLQIIGQNISNSNMYALSVGLGTLLIAILSKKLFPKIPNLLVALTLGSVLAFAIGGESVGLLLVGEVGGNLPPFSMPKLNLEIIGELSQAAIAIALLGLISAAAISRSIAVKSKQVLDNNQEFIGQGLSNIVGGFFSCYLGAGSFTRSGVNYDAGAKTPMSAIFASVFLLIILFFVAPLIAYLPIAGMAGVIMLVGYNLIDFRFLRTVFKTSKGQVTVLVVTFFATLFLELEYAVLFGVIASLFFYLYRTSTPNVAAMAPNPEHPTRHFTRTVRKPLEECPQIKIIRISGSIYFGSIAHISSELRRLTDDLPPETKYLLIQATGVNFIDLAGCEWLVAESRRWKEKGGGLYFSGLKVIAQDALIKGGFREIIGEDHFFRSKKAAISTLFGKVDKDFCATCEKRIFLECRV